MVVYTGLWQNGDNRGGYREIPDGDTDHYHEKRDYGSDRDEEEEEEEEDDEGVPSLTAAFTSYENRPILKLCAMYLAIYFAVAVVAFSYVFERWTVIDSLYFAVSVFTTCGYGDLEPQTTAGQLFTVVFAVYGVIILGVFIGIVGNFIGKYQVEATKHIIERHQDQVLETLFAEKGRRINYKEARDDFLGDHITLADDIWDVVKAEFPALCVVAAGALILGLREHWSITSILYFCVMTASTTGYGDYSPTTQIDKFYCIFFYPVAVMVFGEVLGRIAGVYVQRRQRVAERRFLHRALTLCDLRKMDADQDGSVSKEEFISYMLVALQKVDQEMIDDLREIFERFDSNGSGFLEKADLVKLTNKNYKKSLRKIREEIREELVNMSETSEISNLGSVIDTDDSNHPRHRRYNTIA